MQVIAVASPQTQPQFSSTESFMRAELTLCIPKKVVPILTTATMVALIFFYVRHPRRLRRLSVRLIATLQPLRTCVPLGRQRRATTEWEAHRSQHC